ncbi:MAG: hypothetical protein E7311_01760 [Clostridiales bacterium]|nr:hypothetical protein [Clostridiales bacterium]
MENASKALLIAGAILLVIAIIAIGMTILGQGQDVVNKTGGQIGAMAINAHNSQFGEIHNNAIVKGTELKRIASVALSNNQQSQANKVCDVTITIDGVVLAANTLGNIVTSRDYTITLVTYTNDGAITSFTATVR